MVDWKQIDAFMRREVVGEWHKCLVPMNKSRSSREGIFFSLHLKLR